jgi:hypothetical protein
MLIWFATLKVEVQVSFLQRSQLRSTINRFFFLSHMEKLRRLSVFCGQGEDRTQFHLVCSSSLYLNVHSWLPDVYHPY